MVGYFWLTVSVGLLYAVVQRLLINAWDQIRTIQPLSQPLPFVSVVVAFRNEGENIVRLVNSLLRQNYPSERFELILVDNHSSDGSALTVEKYFDGNSQVKTIDLKEYLPENQAFKKEALSIGIEKANGQIILTTDGDCVVGMHWIQSMITPLIKEEKTLVTGPVVIEEAGSFLEKYQQLDLAGLVVATGGGIQSGYLQLANGANLAFYRKLFIDLGGYSVMPDAKSGDDVFFLQNVAAKQPDHIGFVKSRMAIVTTRGTTRFYDLLQQRKRWASKSVLFRHIPTKIVAVLVFVNSLLICLNLFLGLLVSWKFLMLFLIHFFLKVLIDTMLIHKGLDLQNKKASIKNLLASHILNPFLNVWIFLLIIFRKEYYWKGRSAR